MYIAPATITANITISGISVEKLSQISWKLIIGSGLLLCKVNLAMKPTNVATVPLRTIELNVIHSPIHRVPMILIVTNSL